MEFRIAADLVLLSHLAFIIFVTLGGLLNLRWRRAWMIHLPAILWGFVVEFLALDCPLTDLENYLRVSAGEQGYEGGFIDHFLSSVIYPGLSPSLHIWLGVLLALVNVAVYSYVFLSQRSRTVGGVE